MSSRWLLILCLLIGSGQAATAQPARNPLRFVPRQAEWVVVVDRPQEVLDAVKKHELFQQAQKLTAVREFYDSTNFHRLYQLIAYFEKQLGKSQDELLSELTAGGLVAAGKFSSPQGALLVIQAKDEALLRRFADLALDLVAKELERQESKDRLVYSKHGRFEVGRIGANLSFALADGALLVATDEKQLKAALDMQSQIDPQNVLRSARFADARREAPPSPLAWAWIDLEKTREIPAFKDGLEANGFNPVLTLLVGGVLSELSRSPYISAALTRADNGYRASVFMPCGRAGMPALSNMILPKDDKATLPLLQVPRLVASSSYFLDLGQYWEKRVEILGAKNAKDLEEADKKLAQFLGGIKLAKLLNALGTHHRLVFAQQKESPYKTKSLQAFPAFALVVDMRNPSFAKDMNTIFRAAALLGTFTYGVNLKEESHQGCDMISYYFSEKKKVTGDPNGARFQFNPTYVTVGNQFVMSSTAGLARDLIDALKTQQDPKTSKASTQVTLFASGLAHQFRANEDALLTQLILSQALPPQSAKQEIQTILAGLEQLGTLRFETTYGAQDFHFDALWQPKKK